MNSIEGEHKIRKKKSSVGFDFFLAFDCSLHLRCWWIHSPVQFERQYRFCCYFLCTDRNKNTRARTAERKKITAKPNMNILVGESNDCVERYEWFFASGFFPTVVAFKFYFLLRYIFVSQRKIPLLAVKLRWSKVRLITDTLEQIQNVP